MIALFYGGASSGKSSRAEDFAVCKNAEGENSTLFYLATMQPYGSEGARRIENHKEKRSGKGFVVIEKYTDIADIEVSGGCVLLECLGNLLANEMFKQTPKSDVVGHVCDSVLQLSKKCDNLIMVSSDLSGGCENPSPETLEYIKNMEKINSLLTKISDKVYRVCVGIAICEK